jgi:hypothetical protein
MIPETEGAAMSAWFALLDVSPEDVTHVKRHLPKLVFDEIEGHIALSMPGEESGTAEQASRDLLAAVNAALQLSIPTYAGLELRGLHERREDGTQHRTIFIKSSTYTFSGQSVLVSVSGQQTRTKEERLVSLLQREPIMAELATAMAERPLSWSAMNTIYESVKGLASATGRREDHQGLIDRGWITAEQSDSFYSTAGYERHGHPRKEIKAGVRKMPQSEAVQIVEDLFWRLVEHLEPE